MHPCLQHATASVFKTYLDDSRLIKSSELPLAQTEEWVWHVGGWACVAAALLLRKGEGAMVSWLLCGASGAFSLRDAS